MAKRGSSSRDSANEPGPEVALSSSSAKRAAKTNEDTWRCGGVGPASPFELNLA
eukprot:CAMPEP_0172584164 /NCGR_PEP_ID=MMETSP1068-20121228/3749_1 /TAXON_ID=35684 /ORGANISM="Pseudopedinella elastica, Strain CCMP716" /LENGTH=53 /DNA_ID=CAMNT_0013378249 /DNA_START=49 /DNA_END=206 /DNA_ORIENTATION=-